MDHSLELNIHPFGEVAHSAVDAADYGSGFLLGLFVDLWSAVELRESSLLLPTSGEVNEVRVRDLLLVPVFFHKGLEG